MSAGTPGPLSAKIQLPHTFLDAVGEVKAAIAEIKKELREIDKESRQVLQNAGPTSSVLQRLTIQKEALVRVQSSLQEKLEAQNQSRQDRQAARVQLSPVMQERAKEFTDFLEDERQSEARYDEIAREEAQEAAKAKRINEKMEAQGNELLLRHYRHQREALNRAREARRGKLEARAEGIGEAAELLGLGGEEISGAAGVLGRAGGVVSRVGGLMSKFGKTGRLLASGEEELSNIGIAGEALQRAPGYLSSIVSRAVMSHPIVAAAAVTAVAATKLYSMHTEGIQAEGQSASEAAAAFQKLTGGPLIMNQQNLGSANTAIRVRNAQIRATNLGERAYARDILDIMSSEVFGFKTKDMVEAEDKFRKHAEALEEHKRVFGLDSRVRTEGTIRQAAILAERRSVTVGHLWRSLTHGISATREETWQESLLAAEEQAMRSDIERRKSEEARWNHGVQGAINRVLENEARRHLRAVEQDRVARYNSWSLT